MKVLLEKMGLSAGRAFIGSMVALSYGVLYAQDLSHAKALAVAALFASGAAALRAIQVFYPQLSFDNLVGPTYGKFVDAFARVGISALTISAIGFLDAGNLSFSSAALQAAVVGAIVAGLRAVQALASNGESPVAGFGA